MENAGTEITKAELEDAPAILDLQKLAYESEARLYGDWTIPPLTQTLDSLRTELASSVALKACRDGRVVGSVRARVSDGTCSIGRLIVHPDCQRQGLGSRLLRAVEAAFPDVERFELFTGHRSEGNIRLYRRHGYEPTRTQTVSPDLSLVFLSKPNRG